MNSKCPNGKRGKVTIEWHSYDGKPQKYCYGWINDYTDEIAEECQKCSKHINNAGKDLENYIKKEYEQWNN